MQHVLRGSSSVAVCPVPGYRCSSCWTAGTTRLRWTCEGGPPTCSPRTRPCATCCGGALVLCRSHSQPPTAIRLSSRHTLILSVQGMLTTLRSTNLCMSQKLIFSAGCLPPHLAGIWRRTRMRGTTALLPSPARSQRRWSGTRRPARCAFIHYILDTIFRLAPLVPRHPLNSNLLLCPYMLLVAVDRLQFVGCKL